MYFLVLPRLVLLFVRLQQVLPEQGDVRLVRRGARRPAGRTWPVAAGHQGFTYRSVRPNRCGPVPVYRSGLAGNRSVQVEFKFEFKFRSTTGSYRYTGRLYRYTSRFDRFTGRFDW